jgi:hypothetical protein
MTATASQTDIETDLDKVTPWRAWLKRVGLSEGTGDRMLRSNTGPIITRLSARRIGVRERHHIAWLDAKAEAERSQQAA